jgi:hypothetical protein
MNKCSRTGCQGDARWVVGDVGLCSNHAIDQSIRSNTAATPIPHEGVVEPDAPPAEKPKLLRLGIVKTQYSRGAWRLVDLDTGETPVVPSAFQSADGSWQFSDEPVCGDTKSECVEAVLRVVSMLSVRAKALGAELAALKGGAA